MPIVTVHRRKTAIESVGEKLELIENIIKRGESIEGKLSYTSSTDSSHQISGEGADSENFDNLEYASKSPVARTPSIDPKKFENLELELEQNVRGSTHSNAYEQLALFLATTVHIRELSLFITMFFRNGGIPFLMVYAIELLIFGIPYSLMELSIGQYSSLPAVVLFARIAPIVSGVGYLLLLCRILRSLFVAIEPRYLIYIHNALIGIIIGDVEYLKCTSYPDWICRNPYKPPCMNGHGVYAGERCVNPVNLNHTHKVWSRNTVVEMHHFTEATVSFTPGQIYYLLLENYKASLVVGAFMIYFLAGLISWRGTKFFSKLSFILTIFPLFSMACLFMYTIGSAPGDIFWQLLKPDWSKFFAVQTWVEATQAVSKTMCVADGTMLALGSLSTFNNNVFRDVTFLAIFGFLIRVFFIICMLPLIAITFDPLGYSVAELCHIQNANFWPNLVFWKFVDLGRNNAHYAISLIFYTGMIVSMLGYQVVSYEICLGAIYQRFPRLLYLPEKIVRYCIISSLVGFFTIIYGGCLATSFLPFIEKMQALVYLEMIIGLTLYQLLAVVYFYGAKRLLVNMKVRRAYKRAYKILILLGSPASIFSRLKAPTMCSKHMTVKYTKYGNFAAQFSWAILLPIAVSISWFLSGPATTFRTVSLMSTYYALVGFIPLYVAMFQVVSYILHKKPLHNLFQTHRNWGPINMHHRRNADHDERAARILI